MTRYTTSDIGRTCIHNRKRCNDWPRLLGRYPNYTSACTLLLCAVIDQAAKERFRPLHKKDGINPDEYISGYDFLQNPVVRDNGMILLGIADLPERIIQRRNGQYANP